MLLVLILRRLLIEGVILNKNLGQLSCSLVRRIPIELLERFVVSFSVSLELLPLLEFEKVELGLFGLMLWFALGKILVVLMQLVVHILLSWINRHLFPELLVLTGMVVKIL